MISADCLLLYRRAANIVGGEISLRDYCSQRKTRFLVAGRRISSHAGGLP